MQFDPEFGTTDGTVAKTGHATKGSNMGFSFSPKSGTSSGAQKAMRGKIEMKAPKGQPAGKSLAARSGRMKGLVVKGSAKLRG